MEGNERVGLICEIYIKLKVKRIILTITLHFDLIFLIPLSKMAVSCQFLACLVMMFVVVTHSLIIPTISNVSMTIKSNVCEDKTPFLALVVILSHAGEQKFRNEIRETYPAKEIEPLGFRRVFTIAKPFLETNPHNKYGSISDEQIIEENKKFSDIIQLNFTEEYRRLIYKSYSSFQWASEDCNQAQFIIKADDDLFLDYYSVAKMLTAIKDTADADSLIGQVTQPGAYLAGPFYATSLKTIKLLLETAKTVKANPKLDEDVYFTSDVANVAGVSRVDKATIRPWNGNPHCCAGNGIVYQCMVIAFNRRKYTEEHLMVMKMHGQTCYNFECEHFSKELLYASGVICTP